jgi:hypothetical protein
MVCSSETKWCKSTPKFFQPPTKYKKTNTKDNYNPYKKIAVVKNKRIGKFVKVWECEGIK